MRIHEYIKKSMRLVLVVTAFVVAGSAASQLCAAAVADDEASVAKKQVKKKVARKREVKQPRKKQTKQAKKSPRKKTATKKSVKRSVKRTEVVKVDKAVVALSELAQIKQDKHQGKWEKLSASDEKLDMDVIAVGPNGKLYGVDSETNNFYEHDGKDWVLKETGTVKYVTVAMDGSVLLLSKAGLLFLYKNGETTPVAESTHNFDSVAANSVDDIWAVENDPNLPYGKLYRYQKGVLTSGWSEVGNGIKDVFLTAGKVWAIDFNCNAWSSDIAVK